MLTTLLRPIVARLLGPVGARIPVHPNVLSSLGLVVAVVAGAGFALGAFRWAAVGIALSGMFDLLDGAVARARNPAGSKLGDFVDSAMDRVADSVLFLGIFLHYYLSDTLGDAGAVLAVLALSASNIASYFKARSEVDGVACNVGFVKRADRLILLMLLGILGPAWGVPILSVLVFFSAHSMWARAAFVYHRLLPGMNDESPQAATPATPPALPSPSPDQLYTVGQVAALARVTVRTLHHYDRIGLLSPTRRSESGHRLYDYADLERLRQIRLLRELRFSLEAIEQTLDVPAYERRGALVAQRELLRERQERTDSIIRGVDRALTALEEETKMDATEMFEGLEEFDHTQYEDEVRERWGDSDAYRESMRRTRRYGKGDWARIKEEGEAVFARLVKLMGEGAQAAGTRRHGPGRGAPLPHRPLVLSVQPQDARVPGGDVCGGSALHGVLREARRRAGGVRAGRDPGERGALEEPVMTAGASGPGEGAGDAGVTHAEVGDGSENARFRTTLVRVLLVQVVTLILLWLIQAAYHG